MPSAISPNPRATSKAPDDLDAFFNYDDAVEDFMRDLPIETDPQNNTTKAATQTAKDIDEEITVKKKRRPNPKLDADCLLSQQGLPRLRKITKSHLKFRGKGHEFSDISRLLNTYQLWLDDLFPRAKFRDALEIVEKVGHTRRMQVMRRAWLDDTKPRRRGESPDVDREDDFVMAGALTGNGEEGQAASRTEDGDSSRQPISISDNAPDDDELDALLAENDSVVPTTNARGPKMRGPFEEDSDDDDELDALLAEQSTTTYKAALAGNQPTNGETRRSDSGDDDFTAEEEIMAEMGLW